MTASKLAPHDPAVRLDVVNRLVTHLHHYPQDLVDSKHLMTHFQVSADEFQQALMRLDTSTPDDWRALQ